MRGKKQVENGDQWEEKPENSMVLWMQQYVQLINIQMFCTFHPLILNIVSYLLKPSSEGQPL